MKQEFMTWERALYDARARLADEAEEAWILLEHAGKITRLEYMLHKEERIPQEIFDKFEEYIKKREAHIPLQYITGSQEFMGISIEVTPDVLIPRHDTEILAELVIKEAKGKKVLDLCTGSGCLAVSIAKLADPLMVTAVDISEGALKLAGRNAAAQDVDIRFIKSDMFNEITDQFDIIVSNPPYIPTGEIATLMPEVRDHEPHLALDGTEDGLLFYKIIAEQSMEYMTESGKLFLEIGCEQAKQILKLLEAAGFCNVKVYKDLAGLDRVVTADRKMTPPDV